MTTRRMLGMHLCIGLWAISRSAGLCEEPTPSQALLAALNTFISNDKILSIAADTKTFVDGKLDTTAKVKVSVALNGAENLVAVDYEPFTKFSPEFTVQSTLRTVFNGRYWSQATYDVGNPGKDNFAPVNVVRISSKPNPRFMNYKRRSGLELCLPFFRFQDQGGWLTLRDVLLDRTGYTFSVKEEKRDNASLLKVTFGGDREWVLVDPQKNFVVLEHVLNSAEWRDETIASQITQTRSGLWFATEYTYRYIDHGQEKMRTETKISDVSYQDKLVFEQTLKPKFPPGWRVIDERINKEFVIGQDPSTIINNISSAVK